MRGPVRGAVALAVLAAGLMLSAAAVLAPDEGAAPARSAPEPAVDLVPEGDRELLDEIYKDAEVATADEVPYGEYVSGLWNRIFWSVGGALARQGWLAIASYVVLWVLVVGLGLWIIYVAWSWLSRRWNRVDETPSSRREHVEGAPEPRDLLTLLERQLAAGEARIALRTLWLWLARGLAERGLGRFDLEVTNREFVRSVRETTPGFAGLSTLEDLVRRSDRLLYAGDDVGPDDVRGMLTRARELMA